MASQHSGQLYQHILLGTDNTAACAWLAKGSMTSNTTPAFLLHQLARLHRANNLTLHVHYIPGATNHIADCCSCLFSLSNDDLLTTMNNQFLVQPYWKHATPPVYLLSLMTYSLSNKLQPLLSPQKDRTGHALHGISGNPSAPTYIATLPLYFARPLTAFANLCPSIPTWHLGSQWG